MFAVGIIQVKWMVATSAGYVYMVSECSRVDTLLVTIGHSGTDKSTRILNYSNRESEIRGVWFWYVIVTK